MMRGSEPPAISLEAALTRLDEITRRLDASNLELEESLALYEEGVRLLRLAEGVLNRAEERILQLREDGPGHRLEPLGGEP